MNWIGTQTRVRQEPFDFMSVRVADESRTLVPYNFAGNEHMVEAYLGFEITLSFLITPGRWSKDRQPLLHGYSPEKWLHNPSNRYKQIL